MKRLIAFALAASALWACSIEDKPSERINTEMRLFENEISVPIGSIGPLTMETIFGKIKEINGIGEVLGQVLSIADNGNIEFRNEGQILNINVYELEKEAGDVSAPFTWDAGYEHVTIGGPVAFLHFVGMGPVHQHLDIYASNPLSKNVPVKSNATAKAYDSSYSPVAEMVLEQLSSFTLPRRSTDELIASIDFTEGTGGAFSGLTFEFFSLDLPANPSSNIYNTSDNLFFAFNYKYSCSLASTGKEFEFKAVDGIINGSTLPVGQFGLKQCEVSVVLENSLPIAAQIQNLKAYKRNPEVTDPDASDYYIEDENIRIEPVTIDVAGGSVENPAQTVIRLKVAAEEGTIPDIPAVGAIITVHSQPGSEGALVSSKGGIYVKSSSAKISGGITIKK